MIYDDIFVLVSLETKKISLDSNFWVHAISWIQSKKPRPPKSKDINGERGREHKISLKRKNTPTKPCSNGL